MKRLIGTYLERAGHSSDVIGTQIYLLIILEVLMNVLRTQNATIDRGTTERVMLG